MCMQSLVYWVIETLIKYTAGPTFSLGGRKVIGPGIVHPNNMEFTFCVCVYVHYTNRNIREPSHAATPATGLLFFCARFNSPHSQK